MKIHKQLDYYAIPLLESGDLVKTKIQHRTEPSLANICRQWFRLFIHVSSTTVSLQGVVPHRQLHYSHCCQFKYLFIVLGHHWGQNDWKSSTGPLTKYFVSQHHWAFQKNLLLWQSCQRVHFIFECSLFEAIISAKHIWIMCFLVLFGAYN